MDVDMIAREPHRRQGDLPSHHRRDLPEVDRLRRTSPRSWLQYHPHLSPIRARARHLGWLTYEERDRRPGPDRGPRQRLAEGAE